MRRPSKGLIHPSDRGSQYCSIDYQAELRRHDVCISISGKGNCYDNAMVETFFKTLKSELVWRTVFHTVPKRKPPLPAISTGSTIRPGDTRRLTSSARHSSKNAPYAETMPLHIYGTSPLDPRIESDRQLLLPPFEVNIIAPERCSPGKRACKIGHV